METSLPSAPYSFRRIEQEMIEDMLGRISTKKEIAKKMGMARSKLYCKLNSPS